MIEFPPDLAGAVTFRMTDSHADFFTRNVAVAMVEQDLRPFGDLTGEWMAVPRPLLDDPMAMRGVMWELVDRLRPWTRPDPDWPVVVLFPRLAAAERATRTLWLRLRASRLRRRVDRRR